MCLFATKAVIRKKAGWSVSGLDVSVGRPDVGGASGWLAVFDANPALVVSAGSDGSQR
jgi:hypothetical protein